MANYYETARTNYFRVKDVDAFKAWMDTVPGCTLYEGPEKNGTFCVLFDEEGYPSVRYNEDAEDVDGADPYEEFDFVEELAPHLADGSVAVVVGSGAEKLRYVTGWAMAVDNTGKQVSININSIYDLAKKELGGEVTPAEY